MGSPRSSQANVNAQNVQDAGAKPTTPITKPSNRRKRGARAEAENPEKAKNFMPNITSGIKIVPGLKKHISPTKEPDSRRSFEYNEESAKKALT